MSDTLPFSRGRIPRGTYAAADMMSSGDASGAGFSREILSAPIGASVMLFAGCLRSAMPPYFLHRITKQHLRKRGEGQLTWLLGSKVSCIHGTPSDTTSSSMGDFQYL